MTHKDWSPEGTVACGELVDRKAVRGAWDDVTCPACIRVGRELGVYPKVVMP